MSAMRIRLADVGDRNTDMPKDHQSLFRWWKQRCQKRQFRALLQLCCSPSCFCSPQCRCCCWEEASLEPQVFLAQHIAVPASGFGPGSVDGTCPGTPLGPWVWVGHFEKLKGTILFIFSQIVCTIFKFSSICSQISKILSRYAIKNENGYKIGYKN